MAENTPSHFGQEDSALSGKLKRRVLAVDDDLEVLAFLVDALSAEDIEIVAAGSAEDALAAAVECPVDMVVTDLRLADQLGTDLVARLREQDDDLPAIVITGCDEAQAVAEATRVGLTELMTKPIDVARFQRSVREALAKRESSFRSRERALRLRGLAREMNIQRKATAEHMETTCADLTAAYHALSGQMAVQDIVLSLQTKLVAATCDDETFRAVFETFAKNSGPVFGVALVCDEEAQLRLAGRFGVPKPDGPGFCRALSDPMIELALERPECILLDAEAEMDRFAPALQRFLPGVSVLSIPLVPEPGEMIGLVVLYRKGEQPFTDVDLALAEMVAHPAALAVRRND